MPPLRQWPRKSQHKPTNEINEMRVTNTPYKVKTRAIGSDLEMTIALVGALMNPNASKFGKLQKITQTLTKLLK